MYTGAHKDEKTLEVQRGELERGGRLRWTHWSVVGLSMAFVLLAWRYSITLVESRAETEFERHVSLVTDLVEDRLDHYAIALDGGAGFLAASESVSLDEWHAYVDKLQLADRFPALHFFGVAYRVPAADRDRFALEQRELYPDYRVYPAHDGAMLLPLSLVWPERFEHDGVGLDIARDPERRDVLARAFDAGLTQLSGLVTLGVSGQQGLVLVNPFPESDGSTPGTGHPDGVALAVVLASRLFDGSGAEQGSRVSIRLSDQGGVIHEDDGFASLASGARLSREYRETVHGRDWFFELRSTPAFDAAAMLWLPTAVLVVGLLINALVIVLFAGLSRSNRMALRFAARAGRALGDEREELARKNRELSTANTELEAFGHGLSHDLRSPLNGIQTLVGFASEDLAETDLDAADRAIIEGHLQGVQRQVARGKDLITGLLDYAGLGAGKPLPSRVDVRALVDDIADGLRLGPGRLHVADPMPVIQTCGTRLGQVFENLIGNAVKYHPSPDEAVIEIEACERGDMVRFAVSDDGDGIEPQYREKVFELFGKAHARRDIESSGVGLSIVKKSVDQLGGTITIEEADSGGARIVFTWPRSLPRAA